MKKFVFNDPGVISNLSRNFISIAVNTDIKPALAKKWKVKGLPLMWFLEPDSTKINQMPGYVDKERFLTMLEYFQTESYNKMSFREFLAKR